MAETYYVSIAPHNPLGPVATAAALQFGFATPNFLIQESFRSDVPWRDEVRVEPLYPERGFAFPTDEPGLGVEVNEAVLARHPFQQEEILRYFHPDQSVADW